MESNGWTKVRTGSDDFVIRTDLTNDNFHIFLTDLASLWSINHSPQEILDSCEKFNPLIESPPDKLIAHIRAIIKSGESYEIIPDDCEFSLHISSKLDKLPFIWSFQLKLQESDKFRKYVILPMLFMISESNTIEKELCTIIRKKDAEIEDYKSSSAQLTRQHLETRTFNREDFFAQRQVRSIDSNNDNDFFQTFCQATANSYSAILTEILTTKQSKVDEAGVTGNPLAVAAMTRSPDNLNRVTEANRLEVVKRRLCEEELKDQTKRTKKNKQKLIL